MRTDDPQLKQTSRIENGKRRSIDAGTNRDVEGKACEICRLREAMQHDHHQDGRNPGS